MYYFNVNNHWEVYTAYWLNVICFRSIWICGFLAMFCLHGFFFISSVRHFFSYPVSTVIEYKQQAEMDFPSVTLCNYNMINKSYIDQQNEFIQKISRHFSLHQYSSLDLADPTIIKKVLSVNQTEIFTNGAHSLEDTFFDCSFNGKGSTFSYHPCQFSKELFVRKMTDMGYCYTFHPQSYIAKYGPLKITRTGVPGGLTLNIIIWQDLYYIYNMEFAAGMKVSRHLYVYVSLLYQAP